MRLPFWIAPILAALAWLGTLLALFIAWFAQGRPHYPSMDPDQRIAYISDVGATSLKPLFNVGVILTTVFLDVSFLAERYLRHAGILAPNTTMLEKTLSVLSIAFALLGTAGLILLSFFDTLRHPSLHRLFLLLFMLGYVVSAIFTCWEYQRLGIKYRQHRILRISFWLKLAFIGVEIALAVAFGTMLYKHRQNQGAVLEWVISLIFTFYVVSFAVDLWPAEGTSGHGHLVRGAGMGRPKGGEVAMHDRVFYPEGEQVPVDGAGPTVNGNGTIHNAEHQARVHAPTEVNGHAEGKKKRRFF